jgi:predicted RNase H-related nuclease YkuK (DUF458 family)
MNLPVFIGQMLEEAKRFLKKNDCMENIYIGKAQPNCYNQSLWFLHSITNHTVYL